MDKDRGLLIRTLRDAVGVSQRDMAAAVGCSRTKIFDIEQGKEYPEELGSKINEIIAERLDLAYVAGLFDRKSSITILKMHPAYLKRGINRSETPNPHYVAQVRFQTKHKVLADILRATLKAGSIAKVKNYSNPDKPHYCYMAWSANAETVLEQLLPYIKLRRPQVELILELRSYQNFHRAGGGDYELLDQPGAKNLKVSARRKFLSPEVLAKYEEIHRKVHNLNGKLI